MTKYLFLTTALIAAISGQFCSEQVLRIGIIAWPLLAAFNFFMWSNK